MSQLHHQSGKKLYIFESVKKSIETKYSEADLTNFPKKRLSTYNGFIIKFEWEVHKLKNEMLKMEYIPNFIFNLKNILVT